MPAEWEEHEAIWLAWPHDPDTFPEMEKAEEVYVNIISAIHESEDVNLVVKDEEMKKRVLAKLKDRKVNEKKIHLYLFEYADVWFRDYGPIFLKKGNRLAMTHWTFNAWGGKYEPLMKDTRMPSFIRKKIDLPYFRIPMVLEGGSIDINGKGTLLTTRQCLLNRNRNPELTKEEIETRLKENLGVTNIIWLNEGVEGDDTDGHVDDIARFVNPSTIVCAYEEDHKDGNHSLLKENYQSLRRAKDQDGNKFNVIKLPMPGMVEWEGKRLPASYANFYIGNKVVLAPVFSHKNDRKALEILQDAFPERKVIGIECTNLVVGLGTIHCISQQQPRAE